MNGINIFGSPNSSNTDRRDAAVLLYSEFSSRLVPNSILSKILSLITGIYVQQEVSQRWLIWPATRILHGIILFQHNSKALNLIIADHIPLICNVLISRCEHPSSEFEILISFISAFCMKSSAARQKVRSTSFPSTFIDLLGKRQIFINQFKYAGTLLSIMEEDDESFDYMVPNRKRLFTVFGDLLNPLSDLNVLKTAFLIFTFYFSKKVPERIEALVQDDRIIVNLFNFLTDMFLEQEIRIASLRSILHILSSQNERLPRKLLANGFVQKLGVAWNFLERKDFIWYFSGFMEFSSELRWAFVKNDQILTWVIFACYSDEHKDAEIAVSCISRLLSTLPEPFRTEFALAGLHNAVQENIDRIQSVVPRDSPTSSAGNNVFNFGSK
uniref:Uncharacterized protein n=1 Tax=Panagrolaimus superbus TaxID=310955 RepID=A0A914YFJ3_9BILA